MDDGPQGVATRVAFCCFDSYQVLVYLYTIGPRFFGLRRNTYLVGNRSRWMAVGQGAGGGGLRPLKERPLHILICVTSTVVYETVFMQQRKKNVGAL